MASNFFEKYPKLIYTLDDRKTGQIITDLLRRVGAVDELKNNNSFYDLYDIKEGETPEIVADKIYGDSGLHWIILFLNEIIDPRFDFPLTENDLFEYTVAKYGGPLTPYEIHHGEGYGEDEIRLETNFFLFENSENDNPIKMIFESPDISITERTPFSNATNPLIQEFITNLEFESRINEQKRRIKILKPELVSEIITSFENLINR